MSITHHEMKTALALKKPHWFIAHRDISVARQLFKQYMYLADGMDKPFKTDPFRPNERAPLSPAEADPCSPGQTDPLRQFKMTP
jgi:hypothetical protein